MFVSFVMVEIDEIFNIVMGANVLYILQMMREKRLRN